MMTTQPKPALLTRDECEGRIQERTAALREEIRQLLRIQVDLVTDRDRARTTLNAMGDAVISTNVAGLVEMLNPAAERLLGWSILEAKGRPISQVMRLIDENTRETLVNPIQKCLLGDAEAKLCDSTILLDRAGQEIHISDSVAPIRDRHGQINGGVLVLRDISVQRQLIAQVSYQATHDLLTGLANRREFERRLTLIIEHSRSQGSVHALLYLDLDQFKVINDTCGHEAGDEVLRQVTSALRTRLRERDTFARLGGDEFGLILGECELDEATHIAESLRILVQDLGCHWKDKRFCISISIGVAVIDPQTTDCVSVLNHADSACYVAKQLGRNRVHVFERGDDDLERHRSDMRWVNRLRESVAHSRFRVYYQPIVPLAMWPAVCDEKSMGEVLLRLIDDAGDIVTPDAFLPVAERYHHMMAIDRWVIKETLSLMAQACHTQVPDLCAINVSGQSLGNESFLDYVIAQLRESRVDPSRLCIEITETAAISNLTQALNFIATLRAMGVRFALDDFGSGLSSFSYLKTLKVDYIKISGHFIQDMLRDPLDLFMVESMRRVAQLKGLKCIAEWVESDTVIAKLKEIGVDYIQGNAVAKPRPLASEIEE